MFLGAKYSRGIHCGSWALELFTYNINIIETNIIINAELFIFAVCDGRVRYFSRYLLLYSYGGEHKHTQFVMWNPPLIG